MRENLRAFTSLFATVTDEEFEAYISLYKPVYVKKMDYLFSEGDIITDIYYIDSGLMRAYYQKEGDEYTMGFHFAPFIITDIFALREKVPCALNMQALKNSECYKINIEELEALVLVYPNLLTVFFKLYENLLVNSKKRQQSFIYETPKERYLTLLKERPNVIAEIPLRHIASYLGIKPETLSRIRKKIFHKLN